MAPLSILAAATPATDTPVIVQDLPLVAAGVLIPLVITAALLAARRASAGQQMRDVLGITATFVVLTGVGFLMIIGEHALG